MNIPVILAHGEQLLFAFLSRILAGGSSVVCALVAIVLYLDDKSKRRRLQVVGIIWMITVVLSILIAVLFVVL